MESLKEIVGTVIVIATAGAYVIGTAVFFYEDELDQMFAWIARHFGGGGER